MSPQRFTEKTHLFRESVLQFKLYLRMDKKAHIYELIVVGEDNSTFYVGVTVDPKQRLKAHKTEHLRESMKGKLTWKHLKIKKILSEGNDIDMKIVATFNTQEEAYANEEKFIQEARERGCILTNTDIGGLGGSTRLPKRFSEEGMKAIKDSCKKNLLTKEVREKAWESLRKTLRDKSRYVNTKTIMNMLTGESQLVDYPDEAVRFMGGVGAKSSKIRSKSSTPVKYKGKYLLYEEPLSKQDILKYDPRVLRINKNGGMELLKNSIRVDRRTRKIKVCDMSVDAYEYLIENNPHLKILY